MITQKTAEQIWSAYREIEASNKLLEDMGSMLERMPDKFQPTLSDAFGRRQHLQLGIPSGESSHRIFQVNPTQAVAIIEAHISEQEKKLAALMTVAKLELKAKPKP